MKRFSIALILLTAATAMLSANGQEENPGEEISLELEDQNVVLDVFLPFGPDFHENRLREFKRQYPNIRINQVEISGDQTSKLLTMSASGTAPDVYVMGPDGILNFIRQDALLSLDNYLVSSDSVDREDLMSINQEVYAWDGEDFGSGSVYGFASGWSPDLMMFYNKDLFDAAGVEYPSRDTPMTWEEYRDLLQKLGEKGNDGSWVAYPTIFDHVPIHQMYQFILSNGGSLYNEDGSRMVISEDANTREAIEYFVELQTGPDAVMPYFEDPIPLQGFQMFQSGKLAIGWGGAWVINAFWNQSPNLNWDIAPFPVPEDGERVALVAGMIGQVISSTSEYPNAAWKLFEFLLTEDQRWIAEGGHAIPINLEYADKLNTGDVSDHRRSVNEFMINESEKYAVLYPRSPFVSNSFVDDQFRTHLRDVRNGSVSLDAALRRVEDAVNAEIADWQ